MSHPEGLVSETVEFPPIDDQICDVNREGMFPVHEAYDSTNHTSHISNSLGSNEQDDGSDQEGSPGIVEEVSSESATRNRSVSARFGTSGVQALSEETEGSMGVVPCAPLTSQSQGSQGDSHGAQPTSSTTEPTGANQRSSTGHTLQGQPVRTVLTTRSGREIRKPFRFRDRPEHDVDNQERKRMLHIKAKHGDADAWMKAEHDKIEKFKEMGVFEVRKIPKDVPVIPTRWVYTHNYYSCAAKQRYQRKARQRS